MGRTKYGMGLFVSLSLVAFFIKRIAGLPEDAWVEQIILGGAIGLLSLIIMFFWLGINN